MEKDQDSTASEFASKGGKARAAKLTGEERRQIASKAGSARWDKQGKLPKATHEGPLEIGDITFDTAVLEDGTRVISERKFVEAMGIVRGGHLYKQETDGGKMPAFLNLKSLKPFVDKHLSTAVYAPIRYIQKRGGPAAHGIRAELIPKICEVWLDARKDNKLTASQLELADRAEILVRAFAHVGIIALVDEATGFQYDRQKDQLQEFLAEFISEELRRWVKTFPNQYFKHLCRLRNETYRPDMRLPQYFGHLTNDIVYDRLGPQVLKELQERREIDEKTGRKKNKYFQWLSEELGHPRLIQHLGLVIGLMKVSDDWDGFMKLLDKAAPSWKKDPLFAAATAVGSATD